VLVFLFLTGPGEFCRTTEGSTIVKGNAAPTAALQVRLHAFTAATAAPPLVDTLAHTMAAAALADIAGATARCNGLNGGTVPVLRSEAANLASVVQLLSSATSVATGLVNHIENTLVRVQAVEPVAAQLVKIWNSTAVTV